MYVYSSPSSDESEDPDATVNMWDGFTGINPRMKKRMHVKKLGTLQAEELNMTMPTKCNVAEVDLTAKHNCCVNVKFSARKQAEEIQRKLSQLSPSFFKVLCKSCISNGRVLDFPSDFRDHIPKLEESLPVVDIHLLDGHDHEYVMKYSFCGHNFHGKWRDFYNKHKLSKGDVLVFHQIGDYEFMVFIVRGKMSEADQSQTRVSSDCSTNFEVTLKVPEHDRMKYYMLCASQKQFLHLSIKGLNSSLVVGMILQTITIVDEIKAANFTTPFHDLKRMGINLKSFEDLGLAVGFLRVKVNKLVKLSRERTMARECLNGKMAETEEHKKALTEEVSKLEKLMESVKSRKKLVGDLEAVVDTLKTKSELLDVEFKIVVDSAW